MTTADDTDAKPGHRPEPGADILPNTPVPARPGERPRTEAEEIEDGGEPFGENFA